MTKKEIQEFTDIVTNAVLLEAKKTFPFRKNKLTYHFRHKTETSQFDFSMEAESEEEARELSLNCILSKAKRNEPKKSWPKKVLDEPGLRSQYYIMIGRMREIALERKEKLNIHQGQLRLYFVVTEKTEYIPFDNVISAREFAIKIGKKAKDVEYVTV